VLIVGAYIIFDTPAYWMLKGIMMMTRFFIKEKTMHDAKAELILKDMKTGEIIQRIKKVI